jgi:TatD DNase family protein
MSVDSHCHLADEAFGPDLEAVAARAAAAGLTGALCILSADVEAELARASRVRAAWPAVEFATAIHPQRSGHYAERVSDAVRLVEVAATRVGAVAIGEIGLDYHYDSAPRDVQRDVFAAQVGVAVARHLPVVIHTREAMGDTLAVLTAMRGLVGGVFHCFSGTMAEARAALDIGFYLSLSGIVTFPKAANLREVAAFVPADRLLVETDAPYLAPVPFRGKRNEPAWVTETLGAVAAARGAAVETLQLQVAANFERFLREGRPVDAR